MPGPFGSLEQGTPDGQETGAGLSLLGIAGDCAGGQCSMPAGVDRPNIVSGGFLNMPPLQHLFRGASDCSGGQCQPRSQQLFDRGNYSGSCSRGQCDKVKGSGAQAQKRGLFAMLFGGLFGILRRF